MALSNSDRVGRGLEALKVGLASYVKPKLAGRYGEKWYITGVEKALVGTVGKDARAKSGASESERFDTLDLQAQLRILQENWVTVFEAELGRTFRSYLFELQEFRNKWAHQQPFSADDAYRALDTAGRALEAVGATAEATIVRASALEFLKQRVDAESAKLLKRQTGQLELAYGDNPNLKAWREIVAPHPDVQSGDYLQAQFVANLQDVLSGRAQPEYRDPKLFFERTYLTEGIARLLAGAWRRLGGQGGDPVVGLQTNFGGGKTHTLLSLYHLFGGDLELVDVAGLEVITAQLPKNFDVLPKARRAVLACVALSVSSPSIKEDGTRVQTLWGEMAWQLGGAMAYELVASADQSRTSPGAEALTQLFEQFGPALVLIDEWVLYARQLIGREDLPAGSFEVAVSFAQALTEAAHAAKNALVVVSVPESDVEAGGPNGEVALERLRKVVGRIEASWKPATPEESFEIVRRRLFESVEGSKIPTRDAVCKAFHELYRREKGDFPAEVREKAYLDRLIACYPIHPELFDRLYLDWSTLERFQRTRGLLRLMAAIVHELWEQSDQSLMILPGTVPLYSAPVRAEMTTYLSDGWSPIVDKDIDGIGSASLAIDQESPTMGRYGAARKVARVVFIGSAPSSSAQRLRGIEENRIKLGCAAPGESVPAYGDALNRLTQRLTHLYAEQSRYWFDVQPSLNRVARDRASQIREVDIEDELVRRLDWAFADKGEFGGIHVARLDSADIPDEQVVRLVVLHPRFAHKKDNSPAVEEARKILSMRGNNPRLHQNALIFLTCDDRPLKDLQEALRELLAWITIRADSETLDLTKQLEKQVAAKVQDLEQVVKARIDGAFTRLIVPNQPRPDDPLIEMPTRTLKGSGSLASRASQTVVKDGDVNTVWAGSLLRRELDKLLWVNQPHVGARQVWGYLTKHIYLPRLRDETVFQAAIRDAAAKTVDQDAVAFADAFDAEQGRYRGLMLGTMPAANLTEDAVLVKPEIARQQLELEHRGARTTDDSEGQQGKRGGTHGTTGDPTGKGSEEEAAEKATLFRGELLVDPRRSAKVLGDLSENIIAHLVSIPGSKVKIRVEIEAEIIDGISDEKKRTVQTNASVLRFQSATFD